MPLSPEILFEDADLAAVSKPSGMRTEGGHASTGLSLEDWAISHFGDRARCCHRLDRLTSGVVLIRKNRRFNSALAEMFAKRRIKKSYWALTEGRWPKGVNSVEAPIDRCAEGKLQRVCESGKPAKTTIRIRGFDPDNHVSWVELILKTGRTHQARVHCSHIGCPILGDIDYGANERQGIFGLHARGLKFIHPGTQEALIVSAEPPAGWATFIDAMKRE